MIGILVSVVDSLEEFVGFEEDVDHVIMQCVRSETLRQRNPDLRSRTHSRHMQQYLAHPLFKAARLLYNIVI